MKRIGLSLLKITFAGFILWFLIHHSLLQVRLIGNFFQKPVLAILVIAIFLLMVLLNTWRWYRLNAAQGINLSFSSTFFPTYIGIAFNNILPGNIGGDFIRLYAVLSEVTCSKSAAVLSIFTDRLLGLLGIFFMIGMVAVGHVNLFTTNASLHYLFNGCFILCVASTIFFIASMLMPHQLGVSQWLTKRFSLQSWVKPLLSFLEAIRIYRHKKLIIVEGIFISVLIQGLMVYAVVLIAQMMQLPRLSAIDYAIAIAMTQIANLIPLAPGGLGIGEMAFANILLILNPTMAAPFATVFLGYRLFGILSYLPAIFIYFTNQKIIHVVEPIK